MMEFSVGIADMSAKQIQHSTHTVVVTMSLVHQLFISAGVSRDYQCNLYPALKTNYPVDILLFAAQPLLTLGKRHRHFKSSINVMMLSGRVSVARSARSTRFG